MNYKTDLTDRKRLTNFRICKILGNCKMKFIEDPE